MRTPKRINVGGHVWLIQFVPSKSLKKNQVGACDWEKRTILVSQNLKGDSRVRIILHEIYHAHQFESGLDQVFEDQASEMACEGFASLVTSLFEFRFKRIRKK